MESTPPATSCRSSTSPTRSTAPTASSPTALVGRPTGTDGLSVVDDSAGPQPPRRPGDVHPPGVRPLRQHVCSAPCWATWRRTRSPATRPGARPQQLAEESPVYVFPTEDGDPLGVGNNRQADLIDMRHGYFSNNPLGHLGARLRQLDRRRRSTPPAGRAGARRPGGTATASRSTARRSSRPRSELDDLTKRRLRARRQKRAATASRAATSSARCSRTRATAGSPRTRSSPPCGSTDGTPLPAEQHFVTDFESLRTTGDYPH